MNNYHTQINPAKSAMYQPRPPVTDMGSELELELEEDFSDGMMTQPAIQQGGQQAIQQDGQTPSTQSMPSHPAQPVMPPPAQPPTQPPAQPPAHPPPKSHNNKKPTCSGNECEIRNPKTRYRESKNADKIMPYPDMPFPGYQGYQGFMPPPYPPPFAPPPPPAMPATKKSLKKKIIMAILIMIVFFLLVFPATAAKIEKVAPQGTTRGILTKSVIIGIAYLILSVVIDLFEKS